jgi:hypothetical protein
VLLSFSDFRYAYRTFYLCSVYLYYVSITGKPESTGGLHNPLRWGSGRVGNPRGLTAPGAGPGSRPGSGLTETATGPGSTLTARGGADSLWLQRFAFLKLQPLDTVELYRMPLCSVI